MEDNPVKFSLAENLCSEAMGLSGFVVLLEDSHTVGLSSIIVTMVYLFDILIL